MAAMQRSLGMDAEATEKAAGQAAATDPQDTQMVVDSVADTNPVADAAPSVQE
jgi:hypothetical protein